MPGVEKTIEIPIIIGMSGSVHYENASRIKQTLFQIRESIGNQMFKIASCGNAFGAEKHIKKLALEFGFDYVEYTDYSKPQNLYSVKARYNLIWNPTIFKRRNKNMAKDLTYLVYFGIPNVTDDAWLIDLISQTESNKTKCIKIE